MVGVKSCKVLSKSKRILNSSSAQHGVHADPSTGSGQRGWILTAKLAFFVALGFGRFGSESRPASRRYPLTGTMSRAVGLHEDF